MKRNLPNQITGLVISKIENDSPLFGSIEVNNIILEAQKKKIKDILKKLDYDTILFDAGDFRNKTVIDTITKHNMSDTNILSLFKKKTKKLAINSLIKLIRPKKTKKQKKEDITMIPIICIGNYHIDKKIKEMMKVCVPIELKTPTTQQVENMVKMLMPKLV